MTFNICCHRQRSLPIMHRRKQEELMQSFIHRYARAMRLRFAKAPEGGLISDALIVTANIALHPSSLGYDRQKVNELETAVVAFTREHYPSIVVYFEEE